MIYVNVRAIIERCNQDTTEVVIQTRNRQGEKRILELPGGQVNMFESLIDAVKREVLEETGLEVIRVEGEANKIDTSNPTSGFTMECIQPFAVYQTLRGPVDSMGVYFRCEATGFLKDVGDDSLNPRWINIEELNELLENHQELFSGIDLAGILLYLKEYKQKL